MKKYCILFAAAFLALASCSIEVDFPAQEGTTVYITAVTGHTKTTESGATFSWTDNEQISVGTSDCEYVNFANVDQEQGLFSHTFGGDVVPDLLLAVSPAQPDGLTIVDADAYEICLPASYDYAEGVTNALMVGVPDGKNDYRFLFYHAAALVKVTYANVPVGTKSFVLETPNDFITGTYELNGTEISDIEITNKNDGNDGNSVTITLPEKVSSLNTTLSFYIPVPTGTYHKESDASIKVYLKNASGAKIASSEKSLKKNITLNRGDVFYFPTITLPTETLTKGKEYDLTTSTSLKWGSFGTALVHNNMSWLPTKVSGESGASFGNMDSSGRGQQIGTGSSGSKVKTVRFTGSGYDTYCASAAQGVSSIKLLVGAKNGTTVTGTVKVGDYTMDEASYTAANTAAGEISFSSESLLTGDIVIDLELDTEGALYVKEITINPDDRTDPELSYATSSYNVVTNGTLATPELSHATGFDGTVSYSIEGDPEVASVNASTGAVTIGSNAGSVTVTANFDGNETYKPGSASYTITVEAASLAVSATTPEKAECDANSTVTFTVTSNIAWTATYDNAAIKSVSPTSGDSSNSPTTVTVTLNANSGSERTAEISITPVASGHSALAKTVTVTQKLYTANVVYELYSGELTAGSYVITHNSSYALTNTEGSSSTKRINATSVSPVNDKITNPSASIIWSIEADGDNWILHNTQSGNVYAAANTSGNSAVILTSVTNYAKWTVSSTSSSTSYDFVNVGRTVYLRFNSSISGSDKFATYTSTSTGSPLVLYKLSDGKEDAGIAWKNANNEEAESGTGTFNTSTSTATGTPTFYNPNNISASEISFESDNEDVAEVTDAGVVSIVGIGETTITATFAGNDSYRAATATYALTVSDGTPYAITKNSTNGSIVTKVDNVVVTTAKSGDVVTVVATPNTNYVLDGVAVTKTAGGGAVTMNGDTFVMPAEAVTVSATFVPTYAINLSYDSEKATSVVAKVGGSEVTRAKAGDSVTIEATAKSGYTLASIASDDVTITNGVFTMLAKDVTVTVTFDEEEEESSSTAHLDESGIRTTINASSHSYDATESQYQYDGATWLIRGNANSGGYWVQIRQNATPSYIGVTTSGAIQKVTIKISNATNSKGGVNDITKHGAFSGTISLVTTADGNTSVGSTTTVTNNIAEITPSGNNTTLYIKTSTAARIWDVEVEYAD